MNPKWTIIYASLIRDFQPSAKNEYDINEFKIYDITN